MQLLDAAYHTVHDYPGGAPSLAPRMGKSPHSLNHEVTGSGSAKLGLADAAKLCMLTGDYRVLHAFAESCGHLCVPLPDLEQQVSGDVLMHLAASSTEFADLCSEVCRSVGDGRISDNELESIERERTELLAQLARLGEAIRILNQAGKPSHERGSR
jgi:hypothetical protein